jgi:GNAT superfamily N-acetyltransferase
MRVIALTSLQQRSALEQAPALPPFDARQITDHAADAHICALDPNGRVSAYCSLWWKQTPQYSRGIVGAIGHYASVDDEAAAALLKEAVTRLQENGCTLVVGPMDGNTWRSYRFVTDSGVGQSPEPPFFLEPSNPPEWPRQFEQEGFAKLAGYYSALNSDLARPDERIEPMAARLESAGVRIRSALNSDLKEQLRRIYKVSRVAFTRNFLYTELAKEGFVAQYTGLLDRIRPELLLLAEVGKDLVGYIFAIPDLAQAARGCAIDTFLIKTVAILPEPALRGLGGLLVSRAQQAGHRLGFRRCIHALMHEDNVSRNISNHYAETMRRYTLYSREIAE